MDEFFGVSGQVVDSALSVHKHFGPGLLESVYESCLAYDLVEKGISAERQVPVAVSYKKAKLDIGFRMDLLVANSVVVEVKTVEKLMPVHEAQLLTYLRLSGHKVGLLLNFYVSRMKFGIKRLVV